MEDSKVASLITYLASPLAAATDGAALQVEGGILRSIFLSLTRSTQLPRWLMVDRCDCEWFETYHQLYWKLPLPSAASTIKGAGL